MPDARPAAPPRTEPAPEPAATTRLEAAELDPRPERTQFRIVLRDDHLGRVSLNLTERAGLIDLMVRADKGSTVRVLQDSLPALVDQLAQRNFRAETAAFAPAGQSSDAREQSQDRGRRERRQQEARPRGRARRASAAVQATAQ